MRSGSQKRMEAPVESKGQEENWGHWEMEAKVRRQKKKSGRLSGAGGSKRLGYPWLKQHEQWQKGWESLSEWKVKVVAGQEEWRFKEQEKQGAVESENRVIALGVVKTAFVVQYLQIYNS